MRYVADLHLHSSFAMGTSPQLTLEGLTAWAKLKGIDLLATADFTHPAWLAELRAKLKEEPGELYSFGGVHFVLGTEVSCVYAQGGRTRRLHLLLYAPNFAAVDRLCEALAPWRDLSFDGRPTLRLSGRELVAAALEADPRCVVVPAHAWTPWYGVYGSKGGFDSLAECFGDLLPHIPAIESGLSSDPGMNWRVPELDGMTIVSYSDAHSLARMGREATVFDGELSYEGYRRALREGSVAYTIEFYPEEGKYHYDGHRRCDFRQPPASTARMGDRCPKCGRRLTVGVASRVESLAAREAAVRRGADGLMASSARRRPSYRSLVPLQEIIAETLGRGVATKGVQALYHRLIGLLGPELHLLQEAPLEEIARSAGERLADGIGRVRRGEVSVEPGYDGVYGTVRVWE